jgi:hypothetical protein
MANQSLVAVPPNVEEPVVLQRFLSRLVEQLDVVLGNRAGPKEQYVAQVQLEDTTQELLTRLEEATALLQEAINKTESTINDEIMTLIQANADLITQTRLQVADNFTQAGYGGIKTTALVVIGTIDSTFQSLTGFDTVLITTPKNVVQDLANDSLGLSLDTEWELHANITLTFDSDIVDRTLQLRFYNDTQSTVVASLYSYIIVSGQTTLDISVSSLLDAGITVGDKIQVQLGTAGDTFWNTDNISSAFYANHLAEAGTTLPGA